MTFNVAVRLSISQTADKLGILVYFQCDAHTAWSSHGSAPPTMLLLSGHAKENFGSLFLLLRSTGPGLLL